MSEKVSSQGLNEELKKLIVYIGDDYIVKIKWSWETCQKLTSKMSDETLEDMYKACKNERIYRQVEEEYS